MENATQRPPRRWLQISLKGLLVLTLVVAAFFGGRASMTGRIREAEENAMQERARAERQLQHAQYALHAQLAQQALLEQESTELRDKLRQQALDELSQPQSAEDGSD